MPAGCNDTRNQVYRPIQTFASFTHLYNEQIPRKLQMETLTDLREIDMGIHTLTPLLGLVLCCIAETYQVVNWITGSQSSGGCKKVG